MNDAILVLNAGSSSLKFSLYRLAGGELDMSYHGLVDGIGNSARLLVRGADGETLEDSALPAADQAEALAAVHAFIAGHSAGCRIVAVGHRVVHGGTRHSVPEQVTPEVLAELETLIPLAPLHQPHNLAAIRAQLAAHPNLPQVACFDTAFHTTQPGVAQAFALPRDLYDAGVRRYGFHGLSFEYIARRLPKVAGEGVANGRVVVAHLGNGASMCAIKNGESVAATTGFSALDGLPMGTRCGAIDPGVLLYLIGERGMSLDELNTLLYKRSGLLGISGISGDMRDLLASDEVHAKEAVGLYVYRIVRELGSLAAAMGGLDAVVFTGGIGEHAAPVRERVLKKSAWLGLAVDEFANQLGNPCISPAGSDASAWVIPTDEELMIAQHSCEVLGLGQHAAVA